MLKVLIAAAVFCLLPFSANASYIIDAGNQWYAPAAHKQHVQRVARAQQIEREVKRVVRQVSQTVARLSQPCRIAASQGGSCGCWAQEHLLGSNSRLWNGHNLWLADEWRRVFPHVPPAPGTAAVWPGRHVAPVVAVHPERGTVTVHDSWAIHEVKMRGLIFVQPGNHGTQLRSASRS